MKTVLVFLIGASAGSAITVAVAAYQTLQLVGRVERKGLTTTLDESVDDDPDQMVLCCKMCATALVEPGGGAALYCERCDRK